MPVDHFKFRENLRLYEKLLISCTLLPDKGSWDAFRLEWRNLELSSFMWVGFGILGLGRAASSLQY